MVDILFFTHGRPEFAAASLAALRANTGTWLRSGLFCIEDTAGVGPVTLMNHYLATPGGSEIFAKIDSDTIVPPGWLEACLAVMEAHPELDLLGIEPPSSTVRLDLSKNRRLYAETDSIGGIGVMRRRAFLGRPVMVPHGTYGGFTDWQLRHKEVRKGWILPPLKVFLLDRLPMEPWASLSRKYIAAGDQRPWANYKPADAHLWSWWNFA